MQKAAQNRYFANAGLSKYILSDWKIFANYNENIKTVLFYQITGCGIEKELSFLVWMSMVGI